MLTDKLISVVIPVYNPVPEILQATLRSAMNQSCENIEILLVDDGSETDVHSLAKQMNDPRIVYCRLKHANANVARNYGIEKSNGNYIAMLDADDIWQENHLEDCLKTLTESKADGLYGSLILRSFNNQPDRVVHVRERKREESMIDYLLSTGYGAQTSTLFMRSDTAKDILWNPNLHRHQDYDFVVRYSKKYRWTAKMNPTVIYRTGSKSFRTDHFSSCIRFIRENENDIHPDLYNRYHQNMLNSAIGKGASPEIIRHYRKEATRCREYLSLVQYLTIRQPQNRWKLLWARWEYFLYILRIKIEI